MAQTKKTFRSPESIFISNMQEKNTPAEKKADGKENALEENKESKQKVDRYYRVAMEYKTARLQLLVRPSLKEDLKAEADKENISMNDLVHRILEAYMEKIGRKNP